MCGIAATAGAQAAVNKPLQLPATLLIVVLRRTTHAFARFPASVGPQQSPTQNKRGPYFAAWDRECQVAASAPSVRRVSGSPPLGSSRGISAAAEIEKHAADQHPAANPGIGYPLEG